MPVAVRLRYVEDVYARTPEQNNAIITGSIPRQLLLFFFPIWLGTMFQQLYNTVDT